MKIRKSKVLVLSLLMLVSLVGCDKDGKTSSSVSSQETSQQATSIVDPSALPGLGDITDPSKDNYKGTYYNGKGLDNLEGDALVKGLFNHIKNHADKGYKGLWSGYKLTDIKPGTKDKIWDMYSNCNYTFGTNQDRGSGGNSEGSCYNREHTIPQSWFEGAKSKKDIIKADIVHVVPTDKYVNKQRGNHPHGEVTQKIETFKNGSLLGYDSDGITVFEPIDEYKGDFARIYFYMATCYNDVLGQFAQSDDVFQTSYPYLTPKYLKMYVTWAINDPVSQKEIDRNNGIQKHQGNRNPYVDHPSYFYKAFVKGNF